jgi:platelet-activating factor acetylhydrolase
MADYEPAGTGVLMRLYFPTDVAPPSSWRRSPFGDRPCWMPNATYLHGLMHFIINLEHEDRRWWQRAFARGFCVFAHAFGRLLGDTIPASMDRAPSRAVAAEKKKDESSSSSETKMPLVVFSHGLAGTRTMYAALCTSLASQGYLVAAIEHRDGSASCASHVDESAGEVKHELYRHTDGNYKWRTTQLGVRTKEIHAAIAALGPGIGGGRGKKRATRATIPENVFPGSSFDASAHFADLIDHRRVVAAGHSFGAASVLASIAAAKPGTISRAVLLDPWIDPFGIYDETDQACAFHPLRAAAANAVPTLVMRSERWNADLSPFTRHADSPWLDVEVKGTKHQDFSDIAFRMPAIARRIGMKGDVDARRLFEMKLGLIDFFIEAATAIEAWGDQGERVKLRSSALELLRTYRDEGITVRVKCSSAN